MLAYLFSPAFNWTAQGILALVGVVACIAYYRPMAAAKRMRIYMRLAIGAVVFRVLFAATKTELQYYAWTQSEFSKFLLPPYQSIRVLLQYAWTHFWLNVVISIAAAALFFVVLRALRSYNPRYFEEGEVELGALMALVVGYPQFILFVPAVFLFVVLISIVRGIWLHQPYTTLGLPFFLGAAIAIAVTAYVINAFDLIALAI